jgi:beta-lactamase regulating signal transducer with metallopeptidase domain
LAVVYLFYQLVLRRLTFYNWNRWYLLVYSLLSFFIPFINISPVLEENNLANHEVLQLIPSLGGSALHSTAPEKIAWSIEDWALLFIATGVVLMITRLVIQQISFRRILRSSRLIIDERVKVYQVDKNIIPFSYGNSIFVNQYQHSAEELKEIIRHEFIHVKQKHTVDILWSECVIVLNWYNPFAWLLRNAIRQNLEFIADHQVLQNGINKKEYQYLLLKVIGVNHFSIAPQFNFNSLKKRIAMMNKIKSAKVHLLKFLFLLPLVATLLLSFREKFIASKHADDYQVRYEGLVIDIDSRKPIAGVDIIDKVSGQKTRSDENGRFRFFYQRRGNKLDVFMVFDKNGYLKQEAAFFITYNNNGNGKKGLMELVGMKKGDKAGKCEECFSSMSLKYEDQPESITEATILEMLHASITNSDRDADSWRNDNYASETDTIPSNKKNTRSNTGKMPENVKSTNINNHTVTVRLKDGTVEQYDLNKPEEKEAYIKKYGELPSPPPPPPVPSSKPGVPPPPAPAPPKPNKKGYIVTIADNHGECVVIIKNRENKIIEAIQLTEWNENENEYVEKYGEIPPPPVVIPPTPPRPPKTRTVPETPGVPAPGIDNGIIVAPAKENFYSKPGSPVHPPSKSTVRVRPIDGSNEEPIYVLDGEIQPKNSPVINKINLDDIESVSVIKGELAEKTYGDKGKNGVVVIATRKKNSDYLTSKESLKNFQGLIIVDGEEIDRQKLDEKLNAEDIESIDVLKNEHARKIYGEKGRNGVIVISTKKRITRAR